MLEALRKQTVTLSASAGALTAATTLAAFVGSVSHEDGLVYHGWIDPAAVTAPSPGQFYVISAQGEIREPLCSLTEGDFGPLDERRRGIRFVNRLGEALPSVIQTSLTYELKWPAVERRYVPVSDLLLHNGQILEQRDLAELAKQLSSEDFAEISRLESCAQAIVTSLKNGLQICQLTEVATDQATGDRLGVDFASLCLASETDTEPRPLPDLNGHSMWTVIKSKIGLIEPRSS